MAPTHRKAQVTYPYNSRHSSSHRQSYRSNSPNENYSNPNDYHSNNHQPNRKYYRNPPTDSTQLRYLRRSVAVEKPLPAYPKLRGHNERANGGASLYGKASKGDDDTFHSSDEPLSTSSSYRSNKRVSFYAPLSIDEDEDDDDVSEEGEESSNDSTNSTPRSLHVQARVRHSFKSRKELIYAFDRLLQRWDDERKPVTALPPLPSNSNPNSMPRKNSPSSFQKRNAQLEKVYLKEYREMTGDKHANNTRGKKSKRIPVEPSVSYYKRHTRDGGKGEKVRSFWTLSSRDLPVVQKALLSQLLDEGDPRITEYTHTATKDKKKGKKTAPSDFTSKGKRRDSTTPSSKKKKHPPRATMSPTRTTPPPPPLKHGLFTDLSLHIANALRRGHFHPSSELLVVPVLHPTKLVEAPDAVAGWCWRKQRQARDDDSEASSSYVHSPARLEGGTGGSAHLQTAKTTKKKPSSTYSYENPTHTYPPPHALPRTRRRRPSQQPSRLPRRHPPWPHEAASYADAWPPSRENQKTRASHESPLPPSPRVYHRHPTTASQKRTFSPERGWSSPPRRPSHVLSSEAKEAENEAQETLTGFYANSEDAHLRSFGLRLPPSLSPKGGASPEPSSVAPPPHGVGEGKTPPPAFKPAFSPPSSVFATSLSSRATKPSFTYNLEKSTSTVSKWQALHAIKSVVSFSILFKEYGIMDGAAVLVQEILKFYNSDWEKLRIPIINTSAETLQQKKENWNMVYNLLMQKDLPPYLKEILRSSIFASNFHRLVPSEKCWELQQMKKFSRLTYKDIFVKETLVPVIKSEEVSKEELLIIPPQQAQVLENYLNNLVKHLRPSPQRIHLLARAYCIVNHHLELLFGVRGMLYGSCANGFLTSTSNMDMMVLLPKTKCEELRMEAKEMEALGLLEGYARLRRNKKKLYSKWTTSQNIFSIHACQITAAYFERLGWPVTLLDYLHYPVVRLSLSGILALQCKTFTTPDFYEKKYLRPPPVLLKRESRLMGRSTDFQREYEPFPEELYPESISEDESVSDSFLQSCASDWLGTVEISFNSIVSIQNSRLFRVYSAFNSLANQLTLLIKYWAKQRDICSSVRGTLSGYSWMNLVVFFLQHYFYPSECNPKNVSRIHAAKMQVQEAEKATGCKTVITTLMDDLPLQPLLPNLQILLFEPAPTIFSRCFVNNEVLNLAFQPLVKTLSNQLYAAASSSSSPSSSFPASSSSTPSSSAKIELKGFQRRASLELPGCEEKKGMNFELLPFCGEPLRSERGDRRVQKFCFHRFSRRLSCRLAKSGLGRERFLLFGTVHKKLLEAMLSYPVDVDELEELRWYDPLEYAISMMEWESIEEDGQRLDATLRSACLTKARETVCQRLRAMEKPSKTVSSLIIGNAFNLGLLLYHFFEFYSTKFNFLKYAVHVAHPSLSVPLKLDELQKHFLSPFWLEQWREDMLVSHLSTAATASTSSPCDPFAFFLPHAPVAAGSVVSTATSHSSWFTPSTPPTPAPPAFPPSVPNKIDRKGLAMTARKDAKMLQGARDFRSRTLHSKYVMGWERPFELPLKANIASRRLLIRDPFSPRLILGNHGFGQAYVSYEFERAISLFNDFFAPKEEQVIENVEDYVHRIFDKTHKGGSFVFDMETLDSLYM